MAFRIDSKKIARNTLTLYVRQAVTMLIAFFTVRVTLEQLGVEDYGLNNLVGSIVSMFSFVNGSMGTAVQRFYSYEIGRENTVKLKRVFGTGLYLHSLVTIVTLLLAEVFAVFFLERMNIPSERLWAAQIVFQVSVATLCIGIITVPYSALLRAREMFAQTAMVEIVQALLRLGVLYLLIVMPFDKLVMLSLLNFGVSFAGVAAFVVMAKKFEETHSGPLRDKELVKEMLKFVSMLLFTVLASLANTQGVIMLINLFFGLAINAAYAVAVQVQQAVNNFVVNFKSSMVPQIMASYGAGDLNSMHRLIDFGTKITFLLLLMVTLPIVFSTQWILELWLKTPPQYASKLVALTLISVNITSFTYFHYQGVHASGKIVKQQMWMTGTYLTSILIIFLFFEMGLNFYYAIIVNMLMGGLQACINIFFARKYLNYSIVRFVKKILLPSVVTGFAAVVCILKVLTITEIEPIRFVYVIISDLVVVPVLSMVFLFEKTERTKIVDCMNHFIKRV